MSHDFKPMGVTTICEPPVYQSKCARCGLVRNRRRGEDIRELDEAFKVPRAEGYVYADDVWYSNWPPTWRADEEPPCKEGA